MSRTPHMLTGLMVVLLLVAMGSLAMAAHPCDPCTSRGGICVVISGEYFCIPPKMQPIPLDTTVLKPLPTGGPNIVIDPGHFNDTHGFIGVPNAPSPLILAGFEVSIHSGFLIADQGDHTIAGTNFTLGDGQIAFGALADWNSQTDLLLLTILQGEILPEPELTAAFNPIDQDGDGYVGHPVFFDQLYSFQTTFPSVTSMAIPTPGALSAGLVLAGMSWLGRRRNRRA